MALQSGHLRRRAVTLQRRTQLRFDMKCGRGLQTVLAESHCVSVLRGVLTVRAVYCRGILVAVLIRE